MSLLPDALSTTSVVPKPKPEVDQASQLGRDGASQVVPATGPCWLPTRPGGPEHLPRPVARLPPARGQQAQRQEQLPEQREHRPRNPAGGVGRHAEPLAERRRRVPVGAVGPVRTAGCVVERVWRRAVGRGVPLGGGSSGQTRPEGKGHQQQRRRPAALVGAPLGWALPGHESPEPRSRAERPTGRRRGVRGDETASRWKDGTGAPVRLAGEDMSVFSSPAESLPGHPYRGRVTTSRTSSRPQHWGEGGGFSPITGNVFGELRLSP